jgi:hypothetical protein
MRAGFAICAEASGRRPVAFILVMRLGGVKASSYAPQRIFCSFIV